MCVCVRGIEWNADAENCFDVFLLSRVVQIAMGEQHYNDDSWFGLCAWSSRNEINQNVQVLAMGMKDSSMPFHEPFYSLRPAPAPTQTDSVLPTYAFTARGSAIFLRSMDD